MKRNPENEHLVRLQLMLIGALVIIALPTAAYAQSTEPATHMDSGQIQAQEEQSNLTGPDKSQSKGPSDISKEKAMLEGLPPRTKRLYRSMEKKRLNQTPE